MAAHELGQKPNGQLRTPSPVGRASAPATKPAARQQAPSVPKFDDDPIGAISFALREVGAALQGNPLPSEKAKATAFKRVGIRAKLFKDRLSALKTAFDMIDAAKPEQLEATVKLITDAAPDFNLEEPMRAHFEGRIANMKAIVEGALDNPLFQMFAAGTEEFDDLPLETQFEIAKKFNDFQFELQTEVTKQAALLPGQKKKAEVTEEAKAKFREPKRNIRSGLGGADIDIKTGEVVAAGTLNVIDQKTGKPLTIPIRSAEDLKDALDRLASGEIVEGRIQRTREITDIPGAVRLLLPDLPADMTPEQARLAGINVDLSDKTLEGLLESKGDVEQLDRVFTEIQGIIAETPAALGAAGFIARTGNTIMAQLPLISVLLGVDFDPELLVTENYESTFREIGVESQRLKSATVGAAYALALAQRRRGGRMAQQDVERAMVQISGQDPKATIQVLQDLKQRTAEGFQTRAKNMLGRRPPHIDVTSSPAISKSGAIPKGVVVPEGHEFVRMQAGKVVIRNKDGEEFVQE